MRRVVLIPAGVLLLLSASSAWAQTCSIVDRGSPTDGVTTVTVRRAEAACKGTLYQGWRCMGLRSVANNNGVNYDVDVRWNRNNQSLRGSFTWLLGGGSTQTPRQVSVYAKNAQDELASSTNKIRTVELQFINPDGALAGANGFPNISSVLADLTEYLVSTGRLGGVVGHFGNSGGSTEGSAALAFHRMAEVWKGVVLGGGPVFSDLTKVCTVPTDPVFGPDHVRTQADMLNLWEPSTSCFDQYPSPAPSYDCRSVMGSLATRDYGALDIAVIVGADDEDFIWNSTQEWLGLLFTAGVVTSERPANTSHLVIASQEGANAVRDRIKDIVNRNQ